MACIFSDSLRPVYNLQSCIEKFLIKLKKIRQAQEIITFLTKLMPRFVYLLWVMFILIVKICYISKPHWMSQYRLHDFVILTFAD